MALGVTGNTVVYSTELSSSLRGSPNKRSLI